MLVVSRGDDRLLAVLARTAAHFPQSATGGYAGHHPRDSDAAVAELERLREAGWAYLAFPATSQWWLTHYEGLSHHLGSTATLLHRGPLGLVYDLAARAAPSAAPADDLLEPAP